MLLALLDFAGEAREMWADSPWWQKYGVLPALLTVLVVASVVFLFCFGAILTMPLWRETWC